MPIVFRAIAILILLVPFLVFAQEPRKPDLKVQDLNDHTVSLADLRGKVVLLNFWATWCGPCRAEIPYLVKIQHEYEDSGLRVVGINYPPEEPEVLRKFATDFKLNYPVAIGTDDIASSFEGAGGILPTTVVIDKDGRVRDHVKGKINPAIFLTKIKPLLTAKPPAGE
jgi:thiol-disulfide isomerase/thioredoxin